MEAKPVVLHFTGSVGKKENGKQAKKKKLLIKRKKEKIDFELFQITDSCSS